MTLTVSHIVQGTGAHIVRRLPDGSLVRDDLSVADLEREFGSVAVDSRVIRERDLFFALRGEREDGHTYATHALEAGARGCVVSETADILAIAGKLPSTAMSMDSAGSPDPHDRREQGPVYFFVVPDTLRALQDLASHWRRQRGAEVIGVTGSIGKTTTKEVIASVLAHRWPVLRSAGNQNTEIGLPLTVLHLQRHHRAAVLEMGMYAPGDIALLAHIAHPRMGVVTNVAPIHLERMGTIERIARAKSELIASLPADGLAVLNGDDVWTRAMARTSGIARSVLVGFDSTCDYRGEQFVSHGLEGSSFQVHAEDTVIELETSIPGKHLTHALLSAVAIARALGMDWDDIRAAVSVARVDGRQRLLRDRPGMLIIDDSYNAAPPSMHAALQLLASAPGDKIAVLGDMLELGSHEEEAHRRIGETVAQIADWLIIRGPRAIWIADGARAGGLPARRIIHADSNPAAVDAVLTVTSSSPVTAGAPGAPTMPSDHATHETTAPVRWSVLVKGSRGMEMEDIVEHLRGEA